MICRFDHLRRYPTVFLKMTGLRLNECADLLDDILPRFARAEQHRLHRTTRQRAVVVAVCPTSRHGTRFC